MSILGFWYPRDPGTNPSWILREDCIKWRPYIYENRTIRPDNMWNCENYWEKKTTLLGYYLKGAFLIWVRNSFFKQEAVIFPAGFGIPQDLPHFWSSKDWSPHHSRDSVVIHSHRYNLAPLKSKALFWVEHISEQYWSKCLPPKSLHFHVEKQTIEDKYNKKLHSR